MNSIKESDILHRIDEYGGIIQNLNRMLKDPKNRHQLERIRETLAKAEEGLAEEKADWNKYTLEHPKPVMPLVGKTYRMTFPNDSVVVATLDRIETYPASGMPNDYIFKYVSGDKKLANISSMPGLMPLPEGLIPMLKSLVEVTPEKET